MAAVIHELVMSCDLQGIKARTVFEFLGLGLGFFGV